MSLLLTEEQKQLRESIAGLFAARCTSEYVRGRMATAADSDPQFWNEILNLGIFSAFLTEADGGLGLGIHELGMIAYLAGEFLLPEALCEALLAGPILFSRVLTPEQRQALAKDIDSKMLAGLKEGRIRATIKILPDELSNGSLLRTVPGAVSAELLVAVGAVESSAVKDGVYVSQLRAKGIQTTPEDLIDGTVKHFSVSGVIAPTLIPAIKSDWLRQVAEIIVASQLAGVAARAIALTKEHVTTRKQFGSPIGAFQAVQHKLADMYLAAEAMRALANFAAWSADHSPEQLPLAAVAAFTFATREARTVVERAIQLHGGIGFTWEHDLHLLLRRCIRLSGPIAGADVMGAAVSP
jgi:alkylation response protein AidB-like acyl-CoA dehydrogenase